MKYLYRHWRDSAFQLLALALVIAAFTLSTMVLLRAELEERFAVRTAEMLGGELVLSGTQAADTEQLGKLNARGNIRTTALVDFSTVLVHQESLLLVSARAVDPAYPLYGNIETAALRFAATEAAGGGPAAGELWVADQVLDRLGIDIGDTIQVGSKDLRISQVVRQLPDQSAGFYSMSPRILFNRADLEATRILGPGTRVRHRLMIAAPPEVALEIEEQLDDTLRLDQRLENVTDAAVRSMGPLRQLTLWANLGVLLVSLLCGATVYLATALRVRQRTRLAGLLRSFGATRQQIVRQLLGTEALSVIPITLLGNTLALILVSLLRFWLDWQSPLAAAPRHWIMIVVGPMALWAAFALPKLSSLVSVPAVSILNQNDVRQNSTPLELLAALGAPVLIAGLLTDSLRDLGILLLILVLLAVCIPLLVWPLLRSLEAVGSRMSLAPRLALRRLARRPSLSIPLMASLIAAMVVLTLAVGIGYRLIEDWRMRLPERAPNHFVLNLFDQDREMFQAWLHEHGAEGQPLYPIVRGRLAEINGQVVNRAVTKERERRNEAVNRDLALTEAGDMLASNRIEEGSWHPRPGTVSVEQELAQRLGIALGDRLTFTTSRSSIEATVASIRAVDWDTFEPNFYFMFTPGSLTDQDITWLTGFWLPEGDGQRLATLMQALPHITLFDVNALLRKAEDIVSQASSAAALLAALLMLASLLVLAAGLASGQEQRGRDNALLRTLGGSRHLIRRVVWLEFLTLCTSAAVSSLAIVAAVLFPLSARLFEETPHFASWQVLPLPLAMAIALYAVWRSRGAMRKSPLMLLREGAA